MFRPYCRRRLSGMGCTGLGSRATAPRSRMSRSRTSTRSPRPSSQQARICPSTAPSAAPFVPRSASRLRLPTEWNGGFYMAGCGGCGQLAPDAPGFVNAMNYGLRRGYAAATMDGGHWGTGSTDARWALANRIAEVDWGERAVRETAKASPGARRHLLRGGPRTSIFAGCSTGGRMANMLAVKDPEALRRHPERRSRARLHRPRSDLHVGGRPGQHCGRRQAIITPDVVPLIGEAVLAQCDATDGVEDGLVSDPDACSPDFTELVCEAGQNSPCLRPEQVATLGVWYTKGATNSAGEPLSRDHPAGL